MTTRLSRYRSLWLVRHSSFELRWPWYSLMIFIVNKTARSESIYLIPSQSSDIGRKKESKDNVPILLYINSFLQTSHSVPIPFSFSKHRLTSYPKWSHGFKKLLIARHCLYISQARSWNPWSNGGALIYSICRQANHSVSKWPTLKLTVIRNWVWSSLYPKSKLFLIFALIYGQRIWWMFMACTFLFFFQTDLAYTRLM